VNNRIKGQDTQIFLIFNGEIVNTITAIRSFELTVLLKHEEEMYLGETKPRTDETHGGFSGKVEFVHDDPDVFDFVTAISRRARKRQPGTRVNIQSTLNYPDGRRARIMALDCMFADIPISFGTRADYGTSSLSFSCNEANYSTL